MVPAATVFQVSSLMSSATHLGVDGMIAELGDLGGDDQLDAHEIHDALFDGLAVEL